MLICQMLSVVCVIACLSVCHKSLIPLHLNSLLSKLVAAVLEAHGNDGVRHENHLLEAGLIGDPEGGGVGVDAVGNDPAPDLAAGQLLRGQETHEARVTVMEALHRIKEVSHQSSSLPDNTPP